MATGAGARPRCGSDESPRPIPSTARPSDSACTVAIADAVTAGWRVHGFVTPVPSCNVDVDLGRESERDEAIAHQVLGVDHEQAVQAVRLGPLGKRGTGPGTPAPIVHISTGMGRTLASGPWLIDREATTPSLYEWAGGDQALARLIDCFYDRVEHDELIGPMFPGWRLEGAP